MEEKTLSEKRKELLNKILKIEDKSSHIAIRGLFLQIEEQDKQAVERLKEDLDSTMHYQGQFIKHIHISILIDKIFGEFK